MFDSRTDDAGTADAGRHPLQALVDGVGTESVEAMDTALWSLSDGQLAALVVAHERSARQFAALGLALLRQADRCDAGKAVGAVSTPDWLRDALQLVPGEAKNRAVLAASLDVDAAALAHAARVLATFDADVKASGPRAGYPGPSTGRNAAVATSNAGRESGRRSPLGLDAEAVEALAIYTTILPCTAAGVRVGRISIQHAATIARHLGNLPSGVDPVTAADCEAFLATQALRHDPRSLGRIGAHLVTTLIRRFADSDTDDGDQRSSEDKRREHAEANTYFALTDQGDGTVRAAGCFSEEAADLIRTALEPLAAPQPATDGTPDPRPHGKRQGHALVELCRRSLDLGSLPGSRGTRPHVTVTATVDDLAATSGAPGGQSMWGTPVPPEVLRRICCDASITRVATDPLGLPLHTDSGTRTVTPRQWTALVVRDRGCSFPGCARPAAWCQAHHIWHWADGGPTALGNLVLLCSHHHASVHHHGWRVRIASDRHPEFIPPPWVDSDRSPRRNTYHRIPETLARPGTGAGIEMSQVSRTPESDADRSPP